LCFVNRDLIDEEDGPGREVRGQHEVGPRYRLLPAGLAKLSGQLIQRRAAAQSGQQVAEQPVLQELGFCQQLGHSMQGFRPELEEAAQGRQGPDAEVVALHDQDWVAVAAVAGAAALAGIEAETAGPMYWPS